MNTSIFIALILNLSNLQARPKPKSTLRWSHVPKEHINLIVGQKFALECDVHGSPQATIYWEKDGIKIDNMYNGYKILNKTSLGLSSTKARLDFDCVKPSDSGFYSCVAENDYGKLITHSKVSVSMGEKPTLCDTKDVQKPTIKMWTHILLEHVDMSVILYCRPDAHKNVTLTWFDSNKKELNDYTSNGKYHQLAIGDLFINKIKWSDMGNYYCVVENKYGQVTIESFLYPVAV